jgi:hypothetical protein
VMGNSKVKTTIISPIPSPTLRSRRLPIDGKSDQSDDLYVNICLSNNSVWSQDTNQIVGRSDLGCPLQGAESGFMSALQSTGLFKSVAVGTSSSRRRAKPAERGCQDQR